MANNSLATQQTQLLNSLYKDFPSPSAFTSLEPLLHEAIKYDPKITRKIVQNYLLQQHVYTKHRKAVRRFPRLHTFSPGPKTIWQADLGVMSALGSRNRNYNYYLLCIDCFTRMIFVESIKRKLATDVVDGFEKI